MKPVSRSPVVPDVAFAHDSVSVTLLGKPGTKGCPPLERALRVGGALHVNAIDFFEWAECLRVVNPRADWRLCQLDDTAEMRAYIESFGQRLVDNAERRVPSNAAVRAVVEGVSDIVKEPVRTHDPVVAANPLGARLNDDDDTASIEDFDDESASACGTAASAAAAAATVAAAVDTTAIIAGTAAAAGAAAAPTPAFPLEAQNGVDNDAASITAEAPAKDVADDNDGELEYVILNERLPEARRPAIQLVQAFDIARGDEPISMYDSNHAFLGDGNPTIWPLGQYPFRNSVATDKDRHYMLHHRSQRAACDNNLIVTLSDQKRLSQSASVTYATFKQDPESLAKIDKILNAPQYK